MGEAFYTSLGMDPLPETFWERSMFTKPKGKDVVCHASAWDVQFNDDLRIKMCINPNQEDLWTIHHELGHDFYFQHYYKLPILFQAGANDGFHEAIGDTIAAVDDAGVPQEKGLLDKVEKNDKATINQQMKVALEKIAFLPFGLMVDKWRWDVFTGKVKPDAVQPALVGSAQEVPGHGRRRSTRSRDRLRSGREVPRRREHAVHALLPRARSSSSSSTARCARRPASPGRSTSARSTATRTPARRTRRCWRSARASRGRTRSSQLTGQREMDATAILEYFAPLQKWLEEQNKGQQCGW